MVSPISKIYQKKVENKSNSILINFLIDKKLNIIILFIAIMIIILNFYKRLIKGLLF